MPKQSNSTCKGTNRESIDRNRIRKMIRFIVTVWKLWYRFVFREFLSPSNQDSVSRHMGAALCCLFFQTEMVL